MTTPPEPDRPAGHGDEHHEQWERLVQGLREQFGEEEKFPGEAGGPALGPATSVPDVSPARADYPVRPATDADPLEDGGMAADEFVPPEPEPMERGHVMVWTAVLTGLACIFVGTVLVPSLAFWFALAGGLCFAAGVSVFFTAFAQDPPEDDDGAVL